MSKTKAQRIAKHIENVRRFFPGTKDTESATLAAELRGLERAAHFAAERYCSATNYSDSQYEKDTARELHMLKELLGWKPGDPRVFINGDPRGCALKIADDDVRRLYETKGYDIERDWGGYGLLWPSFDD